MDYAQAREMVARLFECDPEKAQDILAQCCKNKEISDRILFSISHQSADRGSFRSPSVVHELHPSGSPPRQEIPLRPLPGYPTPATTARSEVSRSTKGDTGQKEYIYLLNTAGDSVEQQLVRMKIAPITNSVIRHDLVSKEELDANIISREEGEVHIPVDVDTGTTIPVPFLCIAKLSWCRRKSDRTHRTKFYVVAEENLNDDIIMSYADSGVGNPLPNVPPLHSPETRHPQGYASGLQPSGQTLHPASYHLSAGTNNGSSWTMPAQYQTQHNNQHPHISAIPEVMNAAPSAPGESIGNHHPPHMPSNRFSSPQSIQHKISQLSPRHATVETVPSAGASTANQPDVSSDKLRIAIKWDETRFGVWLYPDDHGQAFFETFRGQAAKRRKSWDRTTTSIIFKESEAASDEKSYELFLDEDSLDADWKDIVKWLENNKKNESPHIFGTVQIEDK